MNTRLMGLIMALACMLSAQEQAHSIMSYNIQQPWGTNWDGRREQVVQAIRTANCDIVATQEAVNYQRDFMAAGLSAYSWYGGGRDGGDEGEGCFIFYKKERYSVDAAHSGNFWLSATPHTPSRFGGQWNRLCTWVRLLDKTTGDGIYIFNLHNYLPGEYDWRHSAVRLVVQRIIARTYPEDPVYVVGDFNSPEADGVTGWMKSGDDNPHHWRDTYRDVHPTGAVNTGFGTKFDYIYCPVDDLYRTSASRVVTEAGSGSDHYPIIADVVYGTDSVKIAPTVQDRRYRATGATVLLVNNLRGDIAVKSAHAIHALTICNPAGRVICARQVAGSSHTASVEGIPPGYYLLQVTGDKGTWSSGFMVR